MKKVFTLVAFATMASFVACGPSAAEQEAAKKKVADSVAQVVEKAKADSVAAAQAKLAEQAKADSTAKAAAKADSIAKAEESKKKPGAKKK